MYSDPYEKISAQELKTMLLGRPVTVVDVRDDDWHGGNIRGSINIPLHELTDQKMMHIVEKVKAVVNGNSGAVSGERRRHAVVFHCFYSQVRGPSAASRFAAYLSDCHDEDNVQEMVKVYVLRGGWQMFKSFYGKDNALVENMAVESDGDEDDF